MPGSSNQCHAELNRSQTGCVETLLAVNRNSEIMKRTILALATVALVFAGAHSARAGDNGWCVAGKVFTGLAVAGAVASAFAPPPVYAYPPAPVYYTTPAPVVVYSAPPAPVYVAPPAPVVVYRRPVYSAPVVGIRFGFGGYHHHHRHW